MFRTLVNHELLHIIFSLLLVIMSNVQFACISSVQFSSMQYDQPRCYILFTVCV